jgi:hypothetical protein
MRFSNRYRTFESWLSTTDKRTGYTQRISRLHNLYPKASLDQLRGHVQFRTKPIPVYKRSWSTLTPRERIARERALAVLGDARKTGKSLHKLAKEHRIRGLVVRRVTNAFQKINGRWKAAKNDRISRTMAINEHGKDVFVEIADSRQASIIGKYHAAVKEYLNTGDLSGLTEFKGKSVMDSSGKTHTLDTDPELLREINERREEPEFYDIYKIDG